MPESKKMDKTQIQYQTHYILTNKNILTEIKTNFRKYKHHTPTVIYSSTASQRHNNKDAGRLLYKNI